MDRNFKKYSILDKFNVSRGTCIDFENFISLIREIWPNIPFFNKEIDEQIEINAHYKGYLGKQRADI